MGISCDERVQARPSTLDRKLFIGNSGPGSVLRPRLTSSWPRIDQYAATMPNWFGVTGAGSNAVFPNFIRFPTANPGLWADGKTLALARRLAHFWSARSAGAGVWEKIICDQFQTTRDTSFLKNIRARALLLYLKVLKTNVVRPLFFNQISERGIAL